MSQLIVKMVKTADYMDKHGLHLTASQMDLLIKEAGIFSALQSLFDSDYSGMKWWDRLRTGFKQGKINKRLGMVIALFQEREIIDREMESLISGVKGSIEFLSKFCEKIKTIKVDELMGTLPQLKVHIKKIYPALSNRKIRNLIAKKEITSKKIISTIDRIGFLSDKDKAVLKALVDHSGDPALKAKVDGPAAAPSTSGPGATSEPAATPAGPSSLFTSLSEKVDKASGSKSDINNNRLRLVIKNAPSADLSDEQKQALINRLDAKLAPAKQRAAKPQTTSAAPPLVQTPPRVGP